MNPMNDTTLFTASLIGSCVDCRIEPRRAQLQAEYRAMKLAESRERARQRRQRWMKALAGGVARIKSSVSALGHRTPATPIAQGCG